MCYHNEQVDVATRGVLPKIIINFNKIIITENLSSDTQKYNGDRYPQLCDIEMNETEYQDELERKSCFIIQLCRRKLLRKSRQAKVSTHGSSKAPRCS